MELLESQQVANRSAVLVPLWRKAQYSLSQICILYSAVTRRDGWHHAAVLHFTSAKDNSIIILLLKSLRGRRKVGWAFYSRLNGNKWNNQTYKIMLGRTQKHRKSGWIPWKQKQQSQGVLFQQMNIDKYGMIVWEIGQMRLNGVHVEMNGGNINCQLTGYSALLLCVRTEYPWSKKQFENLLWAFSHMCESFVGRKITIVFIGRRRF